MVKPALGHGHSICDSPNRTAVLSQLSVNIHKRKMVAVMVPTYPAHFTKSMNLVRSYRDRKPASVLLFFVFSTTADEGEFSKRLQTEEHLQFGKGGVHSINVQQDDPDLDLNTLTRPQDKRRRLAGKDVGNNLPTSKKWFGLWKIYMDFDSIRYVVACDDETVFNEYSTTSSFFSELDAKMKQKTWHCVHTPGSTVQRITKASGSLYTCFEGHILRMTTPCTDIPGVQANLSRSFLKAGAVSTARAQPWDVMCYSWWVDVPTYDLADVPDFFCDNGLGAPPNWKKDKWKMFWVFDHLQYQWFTLARRGWHMQEIVTEASGHPEAEASDDDMRSSRYFFPFLSRKAHHTVSNIHPPVF